MNFIDILIIIFFISALFRGVDTGLSRQVLSTGGLFVGLFIGVIIQGKLIHLVHTPGSKALLAFIVIVGAIGICTAIGERLGSRLKTHIERLRFPLVNVSDRFLGSAVAGISLLIVVWLGATIFASTPMSGLQRQIKGSVIIAQLNKTLPPAPDIVAKLGHLIDPNQFPNVFTGLEPKVDTTTPLPSIGDLDSAVQHARKSIVKIEGAGCGGVSQGSGFVAGEGVVITNAHVVAGVARPYVIDGEGRHRAQVIGFDPKLDMAVLKTNGLDGEPLDLITGQIPTGTAAAILGYPGGGNFTAGPSVIIESFHAIGRDIYNQGETSRQIYSIRGTVRPGNSGGPLIDKTGDVIGLIFAESTTYDNVGYALAMDDVIKGLDNAEARDQTVSTGSCTQ